MSLEGAEVPQKETFDYGKFREKLTKRFEVRPWDLFAEKAKNTLLEKVGKREKEASVSYSDGAIVFTNDRGEVFDPIAEYFPGNRPEIKLVDGDDRDARTLLASRKIDIPKNWVGKRPHQGLKPLHELAHVRLFDQDPARQHAIDDIRLQQLAVSHMINDPKIPIGSIVEELQTLTNIGIVSDLGIPDKDQRVEYLSKMVHDIKRLADDGLAKQYFGEVSLQEYELRIEQERNAWTVALSMHREARSRGITIDNRPIEKIFDSIDTALATQILPEWTHAVKRRSFRKKIGLPEKAGAKPESLTDSLAAFSLVSDYYENLRERASTQLREALHIQDGEVRHARLTSIAQVDSRIIEANSGPLAGLFGKAKEVEIDSKTEAHVRLCLLAYQDWQKDWQSRHVAVYGGGYSPEEQESWNSDNMQIVNTVDISSNVGTDRKTVAFRTANVGKGMPPERIESNIVFLDEKIRDLEAKPIPIYAEAGSSFLFAYRRTSEGGFNIRGFQLIGERIDIIHNAGRYAKEHSIPDDMKVARYLESMGYDVNTVGEICIGMSGTFAGFLKK
jgi:hypothetical protein